MDLPTLRALLDRHAPLQPVPLCPELSAYHARSLVEVWEAAERAAGEVLPAPFWAYPWAAGAALARVLLDHAELVRGRSVLDVGAGGGVSSLAAAKAGAARVVANDIDPLALAVARLAAEAQGLEVETLLGDLTATPELVTGFDIDPLALGTVRLAAEAQGLEVETLLGDLTATPELVTGFDIVIAGDLAYEQQEAAQQLGLLRVVARGGAWVLAGNAGRTWFDPAGMELVAEYRLAVPRDLEGVDERIARVYRVLPDVA